MRAESYAGAVKRLPSFKLCRNLPPEPESRLQPLDNLPTVAHGIIGHRLGLYYCMDCIRVATKLIQHRRFTCVIVPFSCEFISSFDFSTNPLYYIQDRAFASGIQ